MTMVVSCGHVATPRGVGAGYATTEDGERICYDCADARQRERLADPAVTEWAGYVGQSAVTTWTGGDLARVVARWSTGRGQWQRWHFRVVTPDGRRWYGRNGGGAGWALRLRLARGPWSS